MIKKFSIFKLFESESIFYITSLNDVKKYIINNKINDIKIGGKTIIHELIALQLDYENNYDQVISTKDILEGIKMILNSNFTKINHQDDDGNTVLLYSANSSELFDSFNVVDMFIDAGVDIFIKNNDGKIFYDLLPYDPEYIKYQSPEEFNKYKKKLKSNKFNL
jgi:hypothetical protein